MSQLEIISYEKNNQTRFSIVVSETQTPLKLSQSFNSLEKTQNLLSILMKKLTDKNGNFHLIYADKLNADHKIDGKIIATKDNYKEILNNYHKQAIDYLTTNNITHQNQLFRRKKIDGLYKLYENSVNNIIIGATPHPKYPSQYCDEYPKRVTFHQSIHDILVQHFNQNVNILLLNVQLEFYEHQKQREYLNDNDYRVLMEHLETIVDIVDTHIPDNDN